MLLVIDVGNTNIVYGLFDGLTLVHEFRVESGRGRTEDEFLVVLAELLRLHDVDRDCVRSAIIASVVPALTEPMVAMTKKAFGILPVVVTPDMDCGMPVRVDNPRELGADRIVNAVAAFAHTQMATVVVDFGTATTFDCVSQAGEYIGGVIVPGIQVAADALSARAAKLPRVEIVKPLRVIGTNTLTAMQSGIVYGYVGLVDGLVTRLREEMGTPCKVVATGGLSRLIAPMTQGVDEVLPALTLDGLRLLHERAMIAEQKDTAAL